MANVLGYYSEAKSFKIQATEGGLLNHF